MPQADGTFFQCEPAFREQHTTALRAIKIFSEPGVLAVVTNQLPVLKLSRRRECDIACGLRPTMDEPRDKKPERIRKTSEHISRNSVLRDVKCR